MKSKGNSFDHRLGKIIPLICYELIIVFNNSHVHGFDY